jgi:hypothetical protein
MPSIQTRGSVPFSRRNASREDRWYKEVSATFLHDRAAAERLHPVHELRAEGVVDRAAQVGDCLLGCKLQVGIRRVHFILVHRRSFRSPGMGNAGPLPGAGAYFQQMRYRQSETCRTDSVLSLLRGEAVVDQLVDQAGMRERAELHVALGFLGCLSVPVDGHVVNGPRRILS